MPKKKTKLQGFWTGGPYSLVGAPTALKKAPIPSRDEIHPLASFLLFTPPAGVALKAHGELLGDDDFYLAVLLDHKAKTFQEALERGQVYAFFLGEGV